MFGWDNDKTITKYETCSESIIEIKIPNFIFFFYDIEEHKDDFSNALKNIKNNLNLIKNQFVDKFIFKFEEYSLTGLIWCQYFGYYVDILIDLIENVKYLIKGCSCFYDDTYISHDLYEIDSYLSLLNDNLPYIAIYMKN